MEIIGFINSKGGVGKPTVACNIAVEVALEGKSPFLPYRPHIKTPQWLSGRPERPMALTLSI